MPLTLETLVPLYQYCENTGGVLSQPLNFLSCGVFWVGAVWMYTTRSEDDESPSFHEISAILLFLLGLSGMIWHTGVHPFSLALDMFLMFLLFSIIAVVVANDIFRWSLTKGTVAVVLLIVASALLKDQAASIMPQNGGIFLPLLFFLAIGGLKAQTMNDEATIYLLSAAYTLFFGLLARSADLLLCGYFPQGLHFLWHIMLVVSVIYIGKTLAAMKDVPWPEEGKAEEPPETPPETRYI